MNSLEQFKQRMKEREAAHAATERASSRIALTGTAAEQKAIDRLEARVNPLPTCVLFPDNGRGAEFTPDNSTARKPGQDETVSDEQET